MTKPDAQVVRGLYRALSKLARIHDRNPAAKALFRLDDPFCKDCRPTEEWVDGPLGTIVASEQLHDIALRFLDGNCFRPASAINSTNTMQAFLRAEFRRETNGLPASGTLEECFEAYRILNQNVQDAAALQLLKVKDNSIDASDSSPWMILDRPTEGGLLAANPVQICPHLGRSVVLLLRHGPTGGSIGFVVNKATPLSFVDLAHYLLGKRRGMGALSNNVIHAGGPIRTPLVVLHPFAELLVPEDEDPLVEGESISIVGGEHREKVGTFVGYTDKCSKIDVAGIGIRYLKNEFVVRTSTLMGPLEKIQHDALDAHDAEPEIRDGFAHCGIGCETTEFDQVTSPMSTKEFQGHTTSSGIYVSVVDDSLLQRIGQMISEGRAEASQFKLNVGCMIWKEGQLASEWDRNYWYGAASTRDRVHQVAMEQHSAAQYANGALDGNVDNIPRAGALLKMRRMIGQENLDHMLLNFSKSRSKSKDKLLTGIFQAGVMDASGSDSGGGSKLRSFLDTNKSELSEILDPNITPELVQTVYLQKDLCEMAPSEIMFEPDNGVFPSTSWSGILGYFGAMSTGLVGAMGKTRWDTVTDMIRTSSGDEDEPRCNESSWAGLICAMGGEYATLGSLASSTSAQKDLYYSRDE